MTRHRFCLPVSGRVVRLLVLTVAAAGVTVLSVALPVFAQRHLFVLFFAYMVFAVWYGTTWESVGAVVFSVIMTAALLPPAWTTGFQHPDDLEAEAIFLVSAGLLVLLVHHVRRARHDEGVARARAEEAVRQRDALLSLVSHDLKNPLTAIAGLAEILRRQAERAETVDSARVLRAQTGIARAATTMTRLINELLDASRVHAGLPLALECRPLDLVDLVQRVVAGHQRFAPDHHVIVEAAVPQLEGCWDAFRIERVVDNLLSNAIKYSPAGGDVTVTVAREHDNCAMVAVRDTGIGIPAADLARIFEPFQRAGNVGAITGTGIGLAGARQIVTEHGGTLDVQSAVGAGTVATLRLPLAHEQDA